MELNFIVNLQDDPDGGFVVTCPDIPELITAGEDREEALRAASDALATALLGDLLDGKDLPNRSIQEINADHMAIIWPDAWTSAKIATIVTWRESGMTKTELGNRLGKSETLVRRILDPRERTKLGDLERAMRAMGKRLALSWSDAA